MPDAAPRAATAPAADPSFDRPLYHPELETDDEFVSYAPPWLASPDDDLWGSAELSETPAEIDPVIQPRAGEGRQPSDAATQADPDDALAPIAEDLLVSMPPGLPDQTWPERDLAAALVVGHESLTEDTFEAAPEPTVTEVLESEPSLAPKASASSAPPPPPTPTATGPFGWSPTVRYSSVFGDLFRQLAPASATPADPLDWPPVPVNFFRSPASDRPQLNLEPEPAPEVEIHWPEDPRAQIFWPGEEQASPVPEKLPEPAVQEEVERQYDPIYMPRDPRFEPRFLLEDVPADRPVLIFSDPPSSPIPGTEREPESEPRATFDGPVQRLASHASAFAERMPDHWALSAPPSLAMATEEAVARELSEIQSPALTVLFAVVVIAAVLLFVFLVTPLLR